VSLEGVVLGWRPMRLRSALPAAHSMDTTWFAVDADGRVARFDSGETGAVPNDAASAGGSGRPNFDVFALRAACVAHAIDERSSANANANASAVIASLREHALGVNATFARPSRALVVFRMRDDDDGSAERAGGDYGSSPDELIPSGDLRVLRARGPRVLLATAPLSVERLATLVKRSDVEALLDEDSLSDWWWSRADALGLFVYKHREGAGSWGPGAYARSSAPADALSIDALDDGTRAALARLTLPVRFAEDPAIHLADHLRDGQFETYHGGPLREDPCDTPPLPPLAQRTPERGSLNTSVIVLTVAVIALAILVATRIPR
jgi:hypothetical protein